MGTIYSENKNRLETGVVCRATVVRTFHVYWVEAVRTTVEPCSTTDKPTTNAGGMLLVNCLLLLLMLVTKFVERPD